MSLLVLLQLALAITPEPPAEAPTTPTASAYTHPDLEELYDQARYKEGVEITRARLAQNPDDVDLYWHLARFIFESVEQVDRTAKGVDKLAIYEEMNSVSDQGLALSPGHPHLQFAKGIALGRIGTTKGVLSSLGLATDVEQAFLGAANPSYQYQSLSGQEILPCDAYVTLSIFYRLVPDWWVIQALAGTRGDIDKAIQYAQMGNQCSPGRVQPLKELGVAQLCKAQKTNDEALKIQGMASLQKARALTPRSPSDKTDIRHAAMVLENPKMACGYSRDGQQELDREKLDAAGVKAED